MCNNLGEVGYYYYLSSSNFPDVIMSRAQTTDMSQQSQNSQDIASVIMFVKDIELSYILNFKHIKKY